LGEGEVGSNTVILC